MDIVWNNLIKSINELFIDYYPRLQYLYELTAICGNKLCYSGYWELLLVMTAVNSSLIEE